MSYKYCYACRVSLKNFQSNDNEIILCPDCQKEKFLLISKTNAKKKFCLTDSDLTNLLKNTSKNKYGKITTAYYYDDVVRKAHKKFGGVSGLIKAQEKRLRIGTKLKNHNRIKMEEKYTMMQCRRNLIFSELDSQNIGYTENINEFFNYIELGDESGFTFEDIIKMFKEYEFLNNYTEYKILLQNIRQKTKNIYAYEYIKTWAQKSALNLYIKNNGDFNMIPISLFNKYK